MVHKQGKDGCDLASLATGFNELSDLDLTLASTTLFTRVSSQSKTLVDIADAAGNMEGYQFMCTTQFEKVLVRSQPKDWML